MSTPLSFCDISARYGQAPAPQKTLEEQTGWNSKELFLSYLSKVRAQRKQDAKEDKEDGEYDQHIQCMKKNSPGFVEMGRTLSLQDGITCGATHSQHEPAAVDKTIDRNSQIQRCQPVCTQAFGNKKGVCQDVAG